MLVDIIVQFCYNSGFGLIQAYQVASCLIVSASCFVFLCERQHAVACPVQMHKHILCVLLRETAVAINTELAGGRHGAALSVHSMHCKLLPALLLPVS